MSPQSSLTFLVGQSTGSVERRLMVVLKAE
jgi:hypothetical protein